TPYWMTVVGVVKNAKQRDWAANPQSEVYIPYLQRRQYLQDLQSWVSYLTLVVRTTGDPNALAPAIQAEIWSLDKNVTISQVQSMGHVVADATAQPRFYLLLLATFATVALILAAVGIY